MTERYIQAVELLGAGGDRKDEAKKIPVRSGGIFSLERIAKDSPRDQWTIMQVLTTYVQKESPLVESPKSPSCLNDPKQKKLKPCKTDQAKYEKFYEKFIDKNKVSLDVQAALTVIGRREVSQDYRAFGCVDKICLKNSNLIDSNLRSANLTNVRLVGVNLTEASLYLVNLTNAELIQNNLTNANLERANLTNANLFKNDLTNANLNLANLEKTKLSVKDFAKSEPEAWSRLKRACNWDKSWFSYKLKYLDDGTHEWVQDKVQQKENEEYIKKIRDHHASDPKEKPDCSRWK